MNEWKKTALRLVPMDCVCVCVCVSVHVGKRNGHCLQGLERSLCSGSNQANNMFAKKYLRPTVKLLGQLTHVCAGLQVTKWPISTLSSQLYLQSLISLYFPSLIGLHSLSDPSIMPTPQFFIECFKLELILLGFGWFSISPCLTPGATYPTFLVHTAHSWNRQTSLK